MRILIVTSFPIPGNYDGTAMLPIKIARALHKRGKEVVLAYLRARRPWPRRVRSEFEGMPLYTLAPPDWVTGLRAVWKAHKLDLLHAQHYGGATRAYVACRLFRWPMIYEIHSLLGDEVERDRLGRDWKFRAYVALEKRVLRCAAHVITLGQLVKDVIVNERGVPAERVSIIYPGIDLSEYERRRPPVDISGVDRDDPVIMYVGSIVHPNQGVPILIDALPMVFQQSPKSKCVLVGGPLEAGDEYKRRLGELGARLIVLPGRSPDEVVALSRRANVLVHPRLACRENYSVQSKLAVYLAAGRPIVATDFGDYGQILGATGAGLLTSVSSAGIAQGILRVLEDSRLAAQLSAAAATVAHELFGMDRNIERYLSVYRQALTHGPR